MLAKTAARSQQLLWLYQPIRRSAAQTKVAPTKACSAYLNSIAAKANTVQLSALCPRWEPTVFHHPPMNGHFIMPSRIDSAMAGKARPPFKPRDHAMVF
ncbi:hypothetical protein NJC40_15665, partial [Pseudomonas sp. 21LCFQ02]|uniref:hypothetical protein n=1 Tax=Pseudomonas sp. 21LCFQ02 TaxID=2957505 RepID=UPI00209A7A8D